MAGNFGLPKCTSSACSLLPSGIHPKGNTVEKGHCYPLPIDQVGLCTPPHFVEETGGGDPFFSFWFILGLLFSIAFNNCGSEQCFGPCIITTIFNWRCWISKLLVLQNGAVQLPFFFKVFSPVWSPFHPLTWRSCCFASISQCSRPGRRNVTGEQ